MADGTAIEWTDATWNPIRARRHSVNVGDPGWRTALPGGPSGWHCEHVSPGCEHCYAEGINKRLGTGLPFKPGHRKDIELFLDEKMLTQPLRWKRPRTIFVNSMSDTFADFVRDEWIDRMFAVMALCPQHRFQVLTKRAKRMREYVIALGASDWKARLGDTRKVSLAVNGGYPAWPLPNVWLGVSAEDQANADARIPDLLATPAAMRFVSLEPLLGPIDLEEWLRDGHPTQEQVDGPRGMHYLRHGAPRLDWVIVGGESGPHARPMHPDWARSLRDQCQAAGVPYFFKQWGEWHWLGQYAKGTPLGDDGPMAKIMAPSTFPEGVPDNPICMSRRGGKKRAGRLLDGVEWNGMPS